MAVSLPEGISRDEAIANIIPGKILYLNAVFPHKLSPEDKYFVVVGFNERPLLLKINTDCKFSKAYLLMNQKIYTFLKYDSYLDCSTVWYTLSSEEVISQLMANPKKRIIGEILKDHSMVIVQRTNSSKSVTPLHKKIIAEAFKTG